MLQVLLALILFPINPVFSNPPYEPQNFPNCTKSIGVSGEIVCGYTLEKLRRVYRADVDLTKLKKEKPLLDRKIKALTKIIDKQRLQFELAQNSAELLVKRNRELTTQLLETDRALQEEKTKPNWGTYLMWGVVIALTAGFASYVIADVTSDRITKKGVPTHP